MHNYDREESKDHESIGGHLIVHMGIRYGTIP